MKELIIFFSILPGVLLAPVQPWIGALYWTWLSIMNPHRLLSYGWVLSMPWALAIALGTLGGMLITKHRQRLLMTPEVVTFILFMGWMVITTLAAIDMDRSLDQLKKVMKIDLMILVAMVLLYSRKHIMLLVGVLVISLGYYGAKGGVFTLKTGGSERVWGPAGTYIDGNNELALALIVCIPLMQFLRMHTKSVWGRRWVAVLMALTAISALGSQSRGALLAIAAMAFVMWTRSEKKFSFGIVLVVFGVLVVAFMPDSWSNRMNTVQTYEKDASAMGRINAWTMCFNLAKDRLVGGGYEIYDAYEFQRWAPNPLDMHVAHSIYFSVLGEHGFPGLFLFLLMWFFVWRTGGWLRVNGRLRPETKWAADLGTMCQVSLVGYLVGGAFLSLAYFDLPYNLLVLVVVAKNWVNRKAWEQEKPETGRLAALIGYGTR